MATTWATLIAVEVLLTALAQCGIARGAGDIHREPTIILHLSDLHLSINSNKYLRSFGDREGDAKLFASAVVPRLKPSAAIITGDLTDSKDASGAGQQHEAEYASYRQVLEAFVAAGLPMERIFDVRGNHDAFNLAASRGDGTQGDYFAAYSASGMRGQAGTRVQTAKVFPVIPTQTASDPATASKMGKDAVAAVSSWRRRRRLHVKDVEDGDSTQQGEDADRQYSNNCPSALLIGIDFSEAPGLKSPHNFVGHSNDTLASEVVRDAAALFAALPPPCLEPLLLPPPLIAYGHFPLSTVHHNSQQTPPGWTSLGLLSAWTHAFSPRTRIGAMQGVLQALASVPAAMYLNGHLHSAFGERLHRLHPLNNTNTITTDGTEEDSHGGVLAELETGAWKDDRRFRVIVVDAAAVSFADLFFHSPSSPTRPRRSDASSRRDLTWKRRFKERGWGVTAVEPDAVVLDYVTLLTWPPDARYGPTPGLQAALEQQQEQQQGGNKDGSGMAYDGLLPKEGTVRSLVLPLSSHLPHEKTDDKAVASSLGVVVTITGYLPDGTRLLHAPLVAATRSSSNGISEPVLFSAVAKATVFCANTGMDAGTPAYCAPPAEFVRLQVSVRNANGSLVSASSLQPAKLQCRPQGQGRQECFAVPSLKRVPLQQTLFERFTLAVNWPVLLHRVYVLAWMSHMGLLVLLPRALAVRGRVTKQLLTSPLYRPHFSPYRPNTSSNTTGASLSVGLQRHSRTPSPSRLEATSPSLGLGQQNYLIASPYSGAKNILSPTFVKPPSAAESIARRLSWPFAALVLAAGVPRVWIPVVVYFLYVILGPLYLANLMTGMPPAAVFHYGIFGKFSGTWQVVPTPDPLLIALLHMALCLVPMTLWVGCVVGRQVVKEAQSKRAQRGSALSLLGMGAGGVAKSPVGAMLSAPQAVALVAIATANWAVLYAKAANLMGAIALVLSPGFAWAIPLAVALCILTRSGTYLPASYSLNPKCD